MRTTALYESVRMVKRSYEGFGNKKKISKIAPRRIMKNEWKKLLSRFLVIYFLLFFYLTLTFSVSFFLSTFGNMFTVFCLTYTANKAKSNKIFSTFFLFSERKTPKMNIFKEKLIQVKVSLVFTYLFYDPVTHIL